MIIYPAIDIRNGKCVRLYQGNYAQETIYSDSPIAVAQSFLEEGASCLHVVDLDAAKNTVETQAELIKKLLQTLPLSIQVGGGIRTDEQIDAYFASGARRVVLGSLLIESPKTVRRWLKKYRPERFVFAFDVMFRDDKPWVATAAWQKISKVLLFDVINDFLAYGMQHILCTDIRRDGVLGGPNVGLYERLLALFPSLNIQASGGISNLDDIRRLKRCGVSGAITGRALYEKAFDLREALSC